MQATSAVSELCHACRHIKMKASSKFHLNYLPSLWHCKSIVSSSHISSEMGISKWSGRCKKHPKIWFPRRSLQRDITPQSECWILSNFLKVRILTCHIDHISFFVWLTVCCWLYVVCEHLNLLVSLAMCPWWKSYIIDVCDSSLTFVGHHAWWRICNHICGCSDQCSASVLFSKARSFVLELFLGGILILRADVWS